MVVRRPQVLRSFLEEERERLEALIAQMDAEGAENLGYGNHMADGQAAFTADGLTYPSCYIEKGI